MSTNTLQPPSATRPPYTGMNAADLRKALKQEIRWFQSIPQKGSFSGLESAKRLDQIQQELTRRRLRFTPFVAEVKVEVG